MCENARPGLPAGALISFFIRKDRTAECLLRRSRPALGSQVGSLGSSKGRNGQASYLDITETWPEAAYDSPEVIRLLEQLAQLAEVRALYPLDADGTRTPLGNKPEAEQARLQGKAAFWINTAGMPYGFYRLREVGYSIFDVGVAALPVDRPVSPWSILALYITRQVQNPQVCWQWIRFLVEQPANLFQGIPLRHSIRESDAWAKSVGEDRAEVYRETLSRLQFSPQADGWPAAPFWQWWADVFTAIVQNGEDPVPLLCAIQHKAEATLECMQAAGVSPTVSSAVQHETAVVCAHSADPEYLSPEEVWQAQANP